MESKVIELPVTDRLLAWFEANKKPALAGVVVVMVAGLVMGYIVNSQREKDVEASIALSRVTQAQLAGPGEQPVRAEEYLNVAGRYPNSNAGGQALLLAAGSLFTQNKFPEAKAQFERFTREYHTSPLLGQAVLGIAACLDAQGKTAEAETAYKDLIARHGSESFIPQAQFSLARLYEGDNKPELARDLYVQVERNDPYFLGPEAGMRVEELIAKNPKLAPPTPAPAGPPITLEKK